METDTGNECFVKQEGSRRAICLRGELCLATAAPVRTALLAALEAHDEVAIDLAATTEVDLGGLQLLCAAHRSFRGRGVALALRGASAEFRRKAEAGGFEPARSVCSVRDDTCLWRN
jgi:anti-anti-sigma regulatory factor